MQHNNIANTHRSLRAPAIISTSTKWGCPLIRRCSLIRSNTVYLVDCRRSVVNLSVFSESEGGGRDDQSTVGLGRNEDHPGA